MLKNFSFILASSSPRRIELLKNLSLKFKILKPEVKEIFDHSLSPVENSILNSYKKAYIVAKNFKNEIVAGFDTVVEIDGKVLGKPKDDKEAYEMLRLLSGKKHNVITGFTILCLDKKIEVKKYVKTEVWFKDLEDREIKWYILSKEPFDKAGAYGIQGKGAFMIKRINGSYTNVVGLPLAEFLEELKNLK